MLSLSMPLRKKDSKKPETRSLSDKFSYFDQGNSKLVSQGFSSSVDESLRC